MTTPEQLPVETSSTRRMAIVALILMLAGVTMLTVGVSLAFGLPTGLMVLGTVVFGSGVLLGLTS